MNKECIERKEKSIDILKQHNVPYIEHLPCIQTKDEVKIRTKEEIAKRAVACLITIQLACDLNQDDSEYIKESKKFMKDLLQKYQVCEFLTDDEKHIFYDENVTNQEVVNMGWRYEGYWVLLWSLGLVPELEYPSNICNCDFAIKAVSRCKSMEEFLKSATLKSIDEILDQADLIYRYDWACVDARIKGKEAPSGLDGGVVFERHKAFNWLIDTDENDDWDNVSTDT